MGKRSLALVFTVCLGIVALAAVGIVFLGKKSEEPLFGDKVGLVEVKGVIADSSKAVEALDEFRRDSRIRAVLVRVDSPGGGVGASQEIYQEVRRTAAAKPVVCSMGGVAASGGFYIAAACTKIVANPGTVTGSIGVISSIPNLEGLMEKIGVKLETVRSGALKGAGQPDRPLSPEERAMFERMTTDLHQQFVADVARGRNMPLDQVRAVADGGVLTGLQAKQLGLVDELGNYQAALRLAANLGGIKGRPQVVQPQEKSDPFLRRLLKDEAMALLRQGLGELQALGGPQYLYQPLP